MQTRRGAHTGGTAAAPVAVYPRPDGETTGLTVRSPGADPFLYTERHLHCVWFDPALRPRTLRAAQGEIIAVDHPGQWNLEEGPDFRGAVLRVGAGRRRVAGDVEVHIHPADWARHRHAANPAYAGVVAHVTFFPAGTATPPLPPGVLAIALKEPLAANPFFSFEGVDVTAYPYAVRGPAAPCARRLAGWPPDRTADFFEAAGAERMRRKAARLAQAVADQGAEQALYEEFMTALGYKHNRQPFRYLAEHAPLEALRAHAGGDPVRAYALLMGLAGLLPDQAPARWDADTRAFVRSLWDVWWKCRARWSALALSRAAWRLHGSRPHNHPQRRLMLAAVLFAGRPGLADRLAAGPPERDPASALAALLERLQPDADTYWRRRLRFGARSRPRPSRCSAPGARRRSSSTL